MRNNVTNNFLNELNNYYSVTFEELRFFKQQMTTITNYSILIQVALVSGYKMIKDPWVDSNNCLFIIISACIALISCCFMICTHSSMRGIRKTQNIIAGQFNEEFINIYTNGKGLTEYRIDTESYCHQIEFLFLYLLINVGGFLLASYILCTIK